MIIDHRDVAAVLGVPLTAQEVELLNRRLIPMAEAELVALLNRDVEGGTVTGEVHRIETLTYPITELSFHHSPVISVEQVTIDGGDPLDEDSYIVTGWGIAAIALSTVSPAEVSVDYTYGLLGMAAPQADGVKLTLATAAARMLTDRRGNAHADDQGQLGVRSLSVEGYSVSYDLGETGGESVTLAAARVGMFEPNEVEALSRYRRRVIR